MQLEALECGAASLAMVLAYHGKWVPLEQVRKDCGVSRDGSNAKNIVLAARYYGLDTKAYRYEIDDLKKKGEYPCILFWNLCHFVVLDGFKGDKAVINDPARGVVEISMQEFNESFSGIALYFEPSESFEKSGAPKSLFSYVKAQLRHAKSALAITFTTTLLATLVAIIRPGFTRVFMDRLLPGQNPDWIKPFFIAFAAFVAVQIAVQFTSKYLTNQITGKLTAVGSISYLWQALRLPMEFFTQRSVGDIYGRQSLNATIANTLVNTFAPMVLHAVMLAFYLVVMIRYSFVLSIVGIASVLLNVIITGYLTRKRVNMLRVQLRSTAKLRSTTMSGLEMMETIKANGAENGFFGRWAGYQAASNIELIDFQTKSRKFELMTSAVNTLTSTVVTTIGIWFIMNGEFTVGMLAAFQGYLNSFLTPAMNLIQSAQGIQEMRTSMERIDDVMQYPVDVVDDDDDEVEEYSQLRGNLEMKNVTFGYSPMGKPQIQDFNLKLECGKSVAFVGRSGCGKSTLAQLISGLYRPWSGEILYDGKPIDEISHRVLTGSLAVVDQDVSIFADTIANNIKMWDNAIEDFAMILAARDAQLHEDIMLRENGYQHMLQEGGKNLSGGQRQRLEIARVLAQDPTIIILDEATSALDAKTEAAVVKSITDRGITCIVIAHRLSTIRDCDEIVLLEKGKVMERGTHKELYAKGGRYTELVQSE